ncbi:MAG: hypothetical protein JWP63_1067 [Candidatus Solibacter sp.]|jgi:hypothetical protein|nr:hypothetical protein [Candidatus Solibacter sp.]
MNCGDEPSADALSQIERRIVADLQVVRPVMPAGNIVLFAAIFASLLFIAVYSLGAFAITVMSPLQTSTMLGTTAIGTGLLIYSLIHQMVPGSLHRVSPSLLPIAILMSMMGVIAALFQFQPDADFWPRAWVCLRAGTPIGFLAGVPFWLVLRRGAILSPTVTGTAAGLLSGLLGTSVLEIHCPNLDALHILVSHLGAAILCSIAGFTLGLRAERRSASRPFIRRP